MTQNLGGTANDQTWGFSHNPANQITQRTATNDNYNWIVADITRSYTRNGLNQYSNVSGTSYIYDQRGNLTSDGTRLFCFDLENRLLGVAATGGNACTSPTTMGLTYDPLGRIRETSAPSSTTQFLHDGDRLVAEYNGAGALVRRYVYGPSIDEPIVWYEGATTSDRRYLISDRLGSIVAEDGASTIRYSYGPYGEPHAWSGARIRYTGQVALPEARLYQYRARAYDPELGRFLQTDPVGYDESPNLYVYSRNDPLNRIDPTGRDSIVVEFRDQPFPLAGGEVFTRGHAGWIGINEQSGLTRYREFGRYGPNGDSRVRSLTVPNLVFRNGVPTEGSVVALLSRVLDIAQAAGSSNVWITFDASTDFQSMMNYIERFEELDPEWELFGPNCRTFCRDVTGAGRGGRGPRFTTRLTRRELREVAERIIELYREQQRRREEEERREKKTCPIGGGTTNCTPAPVRR